MRVLFAAGGSAGHINPALAVADKVKEVFSDCEILFVGTAKGLEAKLVTRAGYGFAAIKASGFQRKLTPRNVGRNVKAVYHYFAAGGECRQIIQAFKPDIVVGTGGYVTAPVLTAAVKLRIPTVTHESNSLPGITTKLLAKSVDRVFLSSSDTLKYFSDTSNCIVTGNPLKKGFCDNGAKSIDRAAAVKELGLDGTMTILSFGGSLGSNAVNKAVAELIKWEREQGNINHIHSYGGNGKQLFNQLLAENGIVPDKRKNIICEYLYNMYICLAAADLVICRAGSMSQTELKAFGRASIQIPWSGAAENHQYYNALTMKEAGAAILVEDSEISGEKLIQIVSGLCKNKLKIRLMEENAAKMSAPGSAGVIVSEMLSLLQQKADTTKTSKSKNI